MSCGFVGNSDMYGVGIRIGFYLQWYGTIAATWLAKGDVKGLRLSIVFFIGATFLALVIQTSMNALQPVDIYIILLLTYGAYYSFVPLYIWRMATGCNPLLDPTRWSRVEHPDRVYSTAFFALLAAVTSFQLWFWCTGINTIPQAAPATDCPEYGFLFSKVVLNNPVFVAGNITLNIILLIFCLAHFCLAVNLARLPRSLRKKMKRADKHPPRHVNYPFSQAETVGVQEGGVPVVE